jgi:hypothetical protein
MKNFFKKNIFLVNGGLAELANASVIDPRELGSNPGTNRKYFPILFVSH